jgi:hypothetical protein
LKLRLPREPNGFRAGFFAFFEQKEDGMIDMLASPMVGVPIAIVAALVLALSALVAAGRSGPAFPYPMHGRETGVRSRLYPASPAGLDAGEATAHLHGAFRGRPGCAHFRACRPDARFLWVAAFRSWSAAARVHAAGGDRICPTGIGPRVGPRLAEGRRCSAVPVFSILVFSDFYFFACLGKALKYNR